VYWRSHPVLFPLLAATRRWPVLRLGRALVVHEPDAVRHALTRLRLDRLAEGTTGGAARHYVNDGLLFDQQGEAHRGAKRSLADDFGSAGVDRLRPVWTEVLTRRLAPLAAGGAVDLVDVVAELSGATACALVGAHADPVAVARAAREAAAAGARGHLPGLRLPATRRAHSRRAAEAADRLNALLHAAPGPAPSGLAAMVTVAAVNTTVAGIPRAVAWCADGHLWAYAAEEGTRAVLVDELLRVVAPTPLLPRVAGGGGRVGACPVRPGDRLLLVTRHAVGAHRAGPDVGQPAPASVAQLVFGAGPHACPGARLARAQLADTLAALAPHRPAVVRARADRGAALPGWASLVIRAGDA
jgi:cytochrome P450